MASASVVRARGLTRSYRRGSRTVDALRGVDLDVESGEFVVIMGPSGGGKSSLLNLLGGLDTPDGGTLTVAGVDIHSASQRDLDEFRRRHIGFVFQFFNLIGTIDAADNGALAYVARGMAWRDARSQARSILGEFGLSNRLDHRPAELSGGEQQRVAIARAVAAQPQLMLADEPTGDVDAATTTAIMELLTSLNRDAGMTIIVVTHDPTLTGYASRLLTLRDGRFQT